MLPRFLCAGICALSLASAATVSSQPTFYKDVLPVMQKRCQNCHRPGEVAPMSFLTYKDVRPWAKAIREAVLTKKMPPWFADAHYGKFANDRSLAQDEIDTLVSWADAGAREGDVKEAPPPVEWADGWSIGKPDTVVEMPHDFDVPAAGTVEYQYIVIPSGFKEDTWVQAAEARPGNRALVHHIIAFVRPPGSKWLKEAQPGVPFVPKSRESKKDKSKKEESKKEEDDSITLHQAVDLIDVMPHMHYRGKDFEYRLIYPTGETQTVLRVPHYDFNWQLFYYYEKPVVLPAGTRIECTAHFDNSPNNRYNPDPKAEVRWGDQTWEEMMIGWFDVAVDAHKDPADVFREKKKKTEAAGL